MVAIVGGNALGLSLGSMASLGNNGVWGAATRGRSGEQAYVNATTGNLVLRDQDDVLAGRGLADLSLRTYNSLGKKNDDNGDNWSTGIYAQQLRLVGARNAAGSVVVRTDRDGAEASYNYDAAQGLYVSTAGSGAYDTIGYDAPTAQYVFTDGDTGAQDRYDATNGKLLKSRDASGNTLTYAYNGNLLASVTTANGEATFYDYSGNNLAQIRSVVSTAGVAQTITRTHYAYDAANRLSTVTVDLSPEDASVADAKTYTSTYTYDGTSQRVASVTQTDGSSLHITYVQVGADVRVETVKDSLGNLVRYSYDIVARRTTVIDPMGLKTLFDYDAQGQIVKVTSPAVSGLGESSSFAYSASGDLTRITDGLGRTVDMGYDSKGNQILQRDAMGNTVTRSFDARNQLLSETTDLVEDPDGAGPALASQPLTTRYVYDAAAKNLLRFTISADGRVTQYLYDGYGERTSVIRYGAAAYDTSALGVTAVPGESDMAAWVGAQDRTLSMRTDMSYDARGQLQKTTSYGTVDATGNGVADAGRSITQYVYDQAGSLLKTISALNGTTLYTYDGLGRQLSALDALHELTLTQYDDAGAKTSVTLASGLTTTDAYDRAGRLVSVMQSSAATAGLGETRYFYDADSRLRMTQDPTGVRQWMVYDAIGRKVADIDGTGTVTEYTYDASDALTRTIVHAIAVDTGALVDAAGNPRELGLDTIRPAASADDQTAWRIHDAAGRLAQTIDANGAVEEFTYDGASRVVRTTAYATLVAAGALGTAPASVALPSNPADRIARTFYDDDGLTVATLDAEGYLAENQYDAAGRLRITLRHATATPTASRSGGAIAELRPSNSPDDQRTVYLYNGKGQVAGVVDAEGDLTESVYDGDGNPSKTVRYATTVTGSVTPSTSLASIRPAGNAEDQVSTFVYDLLDRVTQSTNAEGTQSRFVYDVAGNLVSSSQAVGTSDVRTLNARFDVQGRLTGELSAEGGALLTGSLTQAELDAVWVHYGISYAYDAAGRRLSATDQNGNRTVFYYDRDARLTQTVNARGEVTERQYNVLGELSTTRRYGTRIPVAGLAGGLADTRLASVLDAVRNTVLDSTESYTYYTTGTLATAKDALGHITSTGYDAFGDAVSVTAPIDAGVSRTDSSVFDRRGLRTGTTADVDGIGATTAASFDAFGRLVAYTDSNRNVRHQKFDRVGRTVQTVDASTALRSTSYDAFGRVLTQVDANQQTTRYSYSTSARSVSVTTPEGVSVTTAHTRFGQTYSIKDGKQQVTTFAYDRDGNLKATKTPKTTTSQNFDNAGRLIETVDARGHKIAYAYDSANRVLTRTVDPSGLALVTTYDFDAKGQQIGTTDPAGTVTTTRFDLAGRQLEQVVDPTGLALRTLWTFDAREKLLNVTDAAGTLTTYTYDKLGRRTKEQTDPAGLNVTRSFSYDSNGNAVMATDGNGRNTHFVYDALDRMVWSVDAAGDVTHTEYDAEGRVLRSTGYEHAIATAGLPTAVATDLVKQRVAALTGKIVVLARRYDRDGRLRFTVDGTGAVVEMRYDANGNVAESIAYANAIDLSGWDGASDPVVNADASRDRHVRTVYDALDRATYSADALGTVTERAYDENGNVTRVTVRATQIASSVAPSAVVANGNDRVTVFSYDNANREIGRTDAMGAVTRTEYDDRRNVVTTTAVAKQIGAGAAPTTGGVTADDRVTVRVSDRAGRLVLSVDPLGFVTGHTYNGDGRVSTTTRYATAVAAGAFPVTPVSNGDNRTERFEYDKAGRLQKSTDAIGGTQRFTYDGLGNKLTFINEKGSLWNYAYDEAGRLASETTPQVELTSTAVAFLTNNLVEGSTASASVVTQLTYDGLGNLTSRTEAAGRPESRTTRYAYDAAGRQISVTYPPVFLYSESLSALSSNGVVGAATRAETSAAVALATSTYYDALGDAVANVDVAGAASFKTYDATGRVTYDVDALGFVTGYVRNAFGESTDVTRYAVVTTLANATPTSAAQAPTATQVAAAVAPADHSTDRLLKTAYDKLGRVASVTEPQAFIYDSTGETATVNGVSTPAASKQTVNSYDAWGGLTRVAQTRTASSWVTTYHYIDKGGRDAATVDALGFLTLRSFDAVGNVLTSTEYTNALAPGTWNASTFVSPAANSAARETDFSYDLLDRKVSETQVKLVYSVAADGTTAPAANATTTYGYDAVGNLTRTTDALKASTYSYYDALGRVVAVVAPARDATASSLIPYTTFRRDAYGNVVVKTEHANGAASAREYTDVASSTVSGSVAAAASSTDRSTVSAYDVSGHATATTDASGANHYFSYNARGQLAKTWQFTLDNAAYLSTTTVFEAFQYDQLGRLTHSIDPPASTGAGLVDTAIEYDAFGDVVRKGVDGSRQEYFDYDGAGRLWRTNTGDGVDRIFLYDLLGRQTSVIQDSGGGFDDRDLHLLASADQAAVLNTLRRTDTVYDALGRVVSTIEPGRADVQSGIRVVRQLETAGITASAASNGQARGGGYLWAGSNKIALSWSSLANLGSGDIRVDLYYTTLPMPSGNPRVPSPTPGIARTRSQVLSANQAAAGTTMTWSETSGDTQGGVSVIKRVAVYKKDVQGNWARIFDKASFGVDGNTVEIAAPGNPATAVALQMRAAGSNAAWLTYATTNFGSALQFDARGLQDGVYDYRVLTTAQGSSTRTSSTGTLTLADAPIPAIATPIAYTSATSGILAWQAQPSNVLQTFRYRVVGSGFAWATLPVATAGTGLQGVDTSVLAVADYEFELQWQPTGATTAAQHAIGTFTVAAPPPIVVASVGIPNLTGIGVGSIAMGAATIVVLHWDAGTGAPSFNYRLVGATAWSTLAVNTSGTTAAVDLASLATGSYEFSVTYATGAVTTALGTGTLKVDPPGAAGSVLIRYDSTQTPVYGDVLFTPPDPSTAIVGSSQGTRGVAHPLGPTSGSDYLVVNGNQTVDGGDGDDDLTASYGGLSGGKLIGGNGDDFLDAANNAMTLVGGAGNDVYRVSSAPTHIQFSRGDGQDTVEWAAVANKNVTLDLQAGIVPSDLVVRRVNDRVLGAAGSLEVGIRGTSDHITFQGFFPDLPASSVYNSLQQITFSDGTTWNFSQIAAAISSTANATVYGTSGNDSMVGTAGDDFLSATNYGLGNDGDDTLEGGAGNDLLDGGDGNNTYIFGRGDGSDRIVFAAPNPAASGTLQFKAGISPGDISLKQVAVDNYGYWALEVSIAGGSDKVTIDQFYSWTQGPNDSAPHRAAPPVTQIRFADGTVWNMATIDAKVYAGTSGADRIFAVDGGPVMAGDGGDLIFNDLSSMTLSGGAGDDQIESHGAADILDGGSGNDRLRAYGHNATYLFGRGDGQDVVVSGTGATTQALQFKPGVLPSDIRVRHGDYGNLNNPSYDLEISIAGTTDSIQIQGYFRYGSPPTINGPVDRFVFADGTVWTMGQIEAHVDTSARPVYGSPVVTGTDAYNRQILAKGYAWKDNVVVAVPYADRGIVGYQTTKTPVYGELTVTTPPYTPSYNIPGTVRHYADTTTTPAVGTTISGPSTLAAVLTISTTTADGDSVNLRPVVNRKVDRWGNVTQISDPRAAGWITTYAYNDNNQVTQVSQPDPAGGQTSPGPVKQVLSSPTTQTYYDILGRQIAVRDADGHINGKAYDRGGNVIAEMHADGGVVTNAYDAFGDAVSTVDAVGNAAAGRAATDPEAAKTLDAHTITNQYDGLGRLYKVSHGKVNVYSVQANWALAPAVVTNLYELYTYDQAGRKIRTTDGAGHAVNYRFDRAGNIIETRKSQTDVVKSTYDAFGRKLSGTDQNGAVETWSYDNFGMLTGHTDIGGATYVYTHDHARQLVAQTNSRNQNLSYVYDGAGQVTSITDASQSQVTNYGYDLSGRHVLERTTQGGVVYQDSHLGYDTLGRLRMVNDDSVHMQIDYDAVGNRTHIATTVNLRSGVSTADDIQSGNRFFTYNEMNEQTAVDAVDAQGDINPTQGHRITYDKNGNRASDTYYGNTVVTTNNAATIIGFDDDGTAVYSDASVDFTTQPGYTTETYAYDGMDRLSSVVRDGVQVDARFYDGSGNVVQTGPNGNLPTKYAAALNVNVAQDSTIGVEQRKNIFDATGHLLKQQVARSDNSLKYEIDYTNYDAAGNVVDYRLLNYDGSSYTNAYHYTLTKLATYRDTQIDGHNAGGDAKFNDGSVRKTYDANGNLTVIDDTSRDGNDRSFVNDVSGNVLQVKQQGSIERQLIVAGEVLGRYGVGVNELTPRDDSGNQQFTKVADFNFGYQPINGNYPTASAGTYAVQSGDTLRSIAQGAYGDAQLWYQIAEANGLSGDGDLRVGQTLTIPNKVGTLHDNAQTIKPYDPSKVVGDATPNMQVPSSDKGCGGLGLILVVVVAIVVTVVTEGALVGVLTTALGPTGGVIAAGAVAGAAGSIAGQAVGNLVGVQHGFSWKDVALGALGGAVSAGVGGITSNGVTTGGIPGLNGPLSPGLAVVRGAIVNATTQGIAIVTGLQDHFSWKGVAASAAASGVGTEVGDLLQTSDIFDKFGKFGANVVKGTLSGLAAGTTAAVLRSGKVDVVQVASDAFGNALGTSLGAASISGKPTGQQGDPLGEFINQNMSSWQQRQANVDQIVGAFSQIRPVDRSNDTLLAGPGGAQGRLILSNTPTDERDLEQESNKTEARDKAKADTQQAAAQANARARSDYIASAAQAASNLYASGAGDVRASSSSVVDAVTNEGFISIESNTLNADGQIAQARPSLGASIEQSRANDQAYYNDLIANADGAGVAIGATFGRALNNAGYDVASGVVGLYALATDGHVRARTLHTAANVIAHPFDSTIAAYGVGLHYGVTTSGAQIAEDLLRFGAGGFATAGIGRAATSLGGTAARVGLRAPAAAPLLDLAPPIHPLSAFRPADVINQAINLGFQTERDEALLWSGLGSGRERIIRSMAYATENGGRTIEMTPGGAWLEKMNLYGRDSPFTSIEADQIWTEASRNFASEASGQVRALLGSVRPASVYRQIELPELEMNPNVTGVDTIYLKPRYNLGGK